MKTGKLENEPICPVCNEILDGYTSVSKDASPEPGDVTICCVCAQVLEFTDDMQLILASEDSIEKISLLEISRAQNIVKNYHKKKE